jgi:LPS sulfotransferase NodH
MSERDFNIAYLNGAVAAGKGGTGIFGLRLMRENLDELSAIIDQVFAQLQSDETSLDWMRRYHSDTGSVVWRLA